MSSNFVLIAKLKVNDCLIIFKVYMNFLLYSVYYYIRELEWPV